MTSPPLKVLLGHNFYRSSSPSGEDAVFRNERQLLENNGIEIISFTRHNDDIDESSFGKRINLARNVAWSKKTYTDISALIKKTKPDYLLILPWNLQKEIVDQHSYIKNWGGKFVIPIPDLLILD